ncbi:MAG: hypothetical protein ACREDH_03360, partial [Methylocella sp.]
VQTFGFHQFAPGSRINRRPSQLIRQRHHRFQSSSGQLKTPDWQAAWPILARDHGPRHRIAL